MFYFTARVKELRERTTRLRKKRQRFGALTVGTQHAGRRNTLRSPAEDIIGGAT
jgi:hypothetical protein